MMIVLLKYQSIILRKIENTKQGSTLSDFRQQIVRKVYSFFPQKLFLLFFQKISPETFTTIQTSLILQNIILSRSIILFNIIALIFPLLNQNTLTKKFYCPYTKTSSNTTFTIKNVKLRNFQFKSDPFLEILRQQQHCQLYLAGNSTFVLFSQNH